MIQKNENGKAKAFCLPFKRAYSDASELGDSLAVLENFFTRLVSFLSSFFPPKIQEVSSCKTWNNVWDMSSILLKLEFLLVQNLCSLNRHKLLLNYLCCFFILDVPSSFMCFSACHISEWAYRMELCCMKALKKGPLFSYQWAFLCMELVQRGFLVTLTNRKLNKSLNLVKIVTNLGFVWLMLEMKNFGD